MREVAPPPSPGPGEALLEIASVGVCGSDYELFRGHDPISHFPNRQGHEFSAWIAAFGPGYAGPLRVGQLVAVEPLLPCQTCIACRRGHPNACINLRVTGGHIDGAFAEQLVMPIASLYPADDLTPDEAAFVEPVSIGVQMVHRSAIQGGDRCVVFGAGPIGQSVILAGRDRGALLLAVDRVAGRLAVARDVGADETVDASADDVGEAIARWTRGEGPVAVFEATGSPAVLRQALDVVAPGGTVVVAGISRGEITFPPTLLVYKELNLLGSRNNAGVFGEALRIVRENRPRVRRLITHTFPLERLQEAFEFGIANPGAVEKIVITVGAGPARDRGEATAGVA